MDDLELIKRRLKREQNARMQAEKLLEKKSLELYTAGEKLRETNTQLEREISNQIRSQQEREQLHLQLIDASRLAGMAEMATGVLHNVGNILNSVNISANVIQKQLLDTALSRLEKISDLMAEHEDGFADFVKTNSRGKKVPAYVARVTEALKQEHQKIASEFDDLLDNVKHIKEIVSVQQSMAKVAGCVLELSPQELINDSITANKATLSNHDIKISHRIQEPLPTLVSDKHKILQILINLIKNAKDALVENDTESPEIGIQVEHCQGDIVFSVSDNGIGISADKIDKVFQHGYTTKIHGHGFGLHSSANAATELGGRLTVSSGGTGAGATFSLALPIACDSRTSAGQLAHVPDE